MKCLLLFPPQWIPFNPHLAPAAIQSILTNTGNEVLFKDLNVEFYNTILTPEFIISSIDKAFKTYNANAQQVFAMRSQKKELKEFPNDFQRVYQRFRETEKIAKENQYQQIASNIKPALNIIKDKKQFYNPLLVDRAFSVIKKAANILSSVYYPSKVNFLEVVALTYYDVDQIKFNCLDKDGNIFYNYYEHICLI